MKGNGIQVQSSKKDGVSHGGWKTTDFVLSFCQPFLFEIQISASKIRKKENHQNHHDDHPLLSNGQ
jgi:hypothetical protein